MARMFFRCSCYHDPMALCSLWTNNPLSRELSFSYPELPRGPYPPPVPISTGGHHSGQVTSPRLEANSVMADLPQNSQATNYHDGHATVQPAVVFPATSYTCVKYVVPATVPGSAPTGTAPLFKPTPWTQL